jgi:hypothetical protein
VSITLDASTGSAGHRWTEREVTSTYWLPQLRLVVNRFVVSDLPQLFPWELPRERLILGQIVVKPTQLSSWSAGFSNARSEFELDFGGAGNGARTRDLNFGNSQTIIHNRQRSSTVSSEQS